MDTIQELFEEYMKAYDEDDFSEYAVNEMRLCFFAGAAAVLALSNEIKKMYFDESNKRNVNIATRRARAIKRELDEFVRELRGSDRIRVN
jgi:hypothetical protein